MFLLLHVLLLLLLLLMLLFHQPQRLSEVLMHSLLSRQLLLTIFMLFAALLVHIAPANTAVVSQHCL